MDIFYLFSSLMSRHFFSAVSWIVVNVHINIPLHTVFFLFTSQSLFLDDVEDGYNKLYCHSDKFKYSLLPQSLIANDLMIHFSFDLSSAD
jgi:hypothetical protein